LENLFSAYSSSVYAASDVPSAVFFQPVFSLSFDSILRQKSPTGINGMMPVRLFEI
jgi:hypothetical protein